MIDPDCIVRIEPGQEISCRKVYVTDDKVMALVDGHWIELKPFNYSKRKKV